MTKQVGKFLFFVITISLVSLSCTKPVDFSQVDDLEISPVIKSSLIFLDEPANQFLDDGTEITTIQDFVLIDFFNNQFIEDNLIKAEFIFETTNTINRGFQVQVDFLDAFNQTQHSFTFSTAPSPSNTNVFSNHKETFTNTTLSALKATRKLIFTLRVLPGNPITPNTLGRISLKSKAVFYFNISNL